MQRGQSTIEYAALLVVVLITACALVRFSTPVERLATDLVRAVVGHPQRAAPHHRVSPSASRHRRPATHHCLCPLPAQARTAPDD
jgi:hypothetical protein